MQKQDQTISYILEENIVDEQVLKEALDEQQTSGQSLASILRNNNLINEEQFIKIIAAGNGIEFINLSPDMIDPVAAPLRHDS